MSPVAHSAPTVRDFLRRGMVDGVSVAAGECRWSAEDLAAEILESDLSLLRDIRVSSEPAAGDLQAEAGDFWFHTDGSFLASPPRWVAVQVIRADSGGEVSLLDNWPAQELAAGVVAQFGGNSGVEARVFDKESRVFRYRRDFMTSSPESARGLKALDGLISCLSHRSLALGVLPNGSWYMIDNWRFLHRRAVFRGQRIIRRIWFS